MTAKSPAVNFEASTRVLVIDDEADMLTNYQRLLRRAGHGCVVTGDPTELERYLNEFHPDLVVTDLVMPNGSGMEVLETVRRHDKDLPVILVTGHGTIENAVEAMKRHASDYLTKPFSASELLGKIQELISQRVLGGATRLQPPADEAGEQWRGDIIGASPALGRALDLTRKVARTDVNVLIAGPSGTGKELFARAIHRLSARRKEIFVPVDCASLPESLLESELFGYRKGAFTGATADKMGLFEFAHKGSLFLDEIGELPITLQSKLLRVLQERRFRPVGSRGEIEIDVRVIAATNRDLEQAIEDKTFRSDLYYRLNVVTIRLPSLAERPEDIPLLGARFLRLFCEGNRSQVRGISSRSMERLMAYSWPGNVRELQNVIERAATLASGPMILPRDLPDALRRPGAEPADEEGEDFESAEGEAAAAANADSSGFFLSKDRLVKTFERDYLIALLLENDLNISEAAQKAGCHRRTLYRMIHRHGLDLSELRRKKRPGS